MITWKLTDRLLMFLLFYLQSLWHSNILHITKEKEQEQKPCVTGCLCLTELWDGFYCIFFLNKQPRTYKKYLKNFWKIYKSFNNEGDDTKYHFRKKQKTQNKTKQNSATLWISKWKHLNNEVWKQISFFLCRYSSFLPELVNSLVKHIVHWLYLSTRIIQLIY